MLRITRWVTGVAFIVLCGMVVVTLADIVLRLLSRMPGHPFARLIPPAVPGVVDLVQLTLVTVAHLSVAATFLVGTHVTVDVIANLMPHKARRLARLFGWAVSFAFMALCFVEAIVQGRGQYQDGILSATISLPMWWYWIPVVIGTGLAALACLGHIAGWAAKTDRSL
ncbi:MAG TPA: TRAP transporter small permease [Pseudolabrys sp.]|nr:TRAP transporter small permease [Pseudolabrys sp.]